MKTKNIGQSGIFSWTNSPSVNEDLVTQSIVTALQYYQLQLKKKQLDNPFKYQPAWSNLEKVISPDEFKQQYSLVPGNDMVGDDSTGWVGSFTIVHKQTRTNMPGFSIKPFDNSCGSVNPEYKNEFNEIGELIKSFNLGETMYYIQFEKETKTPPLQNTTNPLSNETDLTLSQNSDTRPDLTPVTKTALTSSLPRMNLTDYLSTIREIAPKYETSIINSLIASGVFSTSNMPAMQSAADDDEAAASCIASSSTQSDKTQESDRSKGEEKESESISNANTV